MDQDGGNQGQYIKEAVCLKSNGPYEDITLDGKQTLPC